MVQRCQALIFFRITSSRRPRYLPVWITALLLKPETVPRLSKGLSVCYEWVDIFYRYILWFSKYSPHTLGVPKMVLGSVHGQNYFHNNIKTIFGLFHCVGIFADCTKADETAGILAWIKAVWHQLVLYLYSSLLQCNKTIESTFT